MVTGINIGSSFQPEDFIKRDRCMDGNENTVGGLGLLGSHCAFA